jgi:phosphorylcholine metabolism protein LicD
MDQTSKNYKLKDCCRANLMKIIVKIPEILENTNWWLDFGTLLGFYRDGKIIDWDSDLDVGILHEDFYKNKQEIENKVKNYGFYLTRESDIFYRINFSSINHLHCDIFLFKENEKGILRMVFKEYFSKKNEIFPVLKKNFFGLDFNVPHDIEFFLETRYGKDWRNPISRGNGYKSIERK